MADQKPWEKYSDSAPKPWEKYAQSSTPPPEAPKEPSIPMRALDAIVKALDYTGGAARAAVASPLNLTGKDVVNWDETKQALGGRAPFPSTSDYLERAGVPAGASLSDAIPQIYSPTGEGLPLQKGGMFDPTVRGAAGFVGDVALDPLTYASMGTSAASKAGKMSLAQRALNPIESAAKNSGEGFYKSAFKNIDKDLVPLGKDPISDKLLQTGFTGNMQDAAKANLALQDVAGKGIGATTKEAANLGAKTDLLGATSDAQKLLEKFRASPNIEIQAMADKLEPLVQGYVSKGAEAAKDIVGPGRPMVPVNEANAWKSELYKKLKDFAYKTQTPSEKQQIEKSLANGLNQGVLNSTEAVSPDLAQRLAEYNSTFGSSRKAESSFLREAKKEVTKNPITAIDMMIGGAGVGASYKDPEHAPEYLAALGLKKLGGAILSTRGRTMIGKGMLRAAENTKGIPDSVARRSLEDLLKEQEQKK